MKKTVFILALAGAAFSAAAKIPLPPADEAAKAKAAETAAKAAWQAKLDGYQLCKAQDRVAAKYGKAGAKLVPVSAKPAAATASAAASAAAGATTPVAAAPLTPCADPGPFAYSPPQDKPQEKPLETSGAHSPAGTAASPPSVRSEAAKIQPSGKTAKQ